MVEKLRKFSRKKIAVETGDVFLIRQSNDQCSLAQLLAVWPDMASIVTFGIFVTEVPCEHSAPHFYENVVRLDSSRLDLITIISTGVGVVRSGQWERVCTAPVGLPPTLLPKQPFETGSSIGGAIQSAPLVEGLVEAYRGLAGWDDQLPGRPGYLSSLLFKGR